MCRGLPKRRTALQTSSSQFQAQRYVIVVVVIKHSKAKWYIRKGLAKVIEDSDTKFVVQFTFPADELEEYKHGIRPMPTKVILLQIKIENIIFSIIF